MSTAAVRLPLIKEVRAFCEKKPPAKDNTNDDSTSVAGAGQGADCHNVVDQHWINGYPTPISNPMSRYAAYTQFRKSWGINALGTVVVEVVAEDGSSGVGVSIGGDPACYIVEQHLARFVEGQNPAAIELMHDQMMTACINYGRKGLAIQAVSAVDLALWDLLGKLRKAPVFELLGGPVREELPLYCTSSRPDVCKKLGFVGAKVGCPYGPSDGDEGIRKNVAFLEKHRQALRDSAKEDDAPRKPHKESLSECHPFDRHVPMYEDYPLALDCYMSFTVPYTLRLMKAIQHINIKWIEEFLPPDDYEGYRTVYQQAGGNGEMMLTTGEHEYTAKGFQLLLEKDCVDILQPDVTWVGGITECRKIVAMAAAKGKLVIPHGSSMYSYHLQFAFVNTPVAEFINLHPDCTELAPYFGNLFDGEILPQNGRIYVDQLGERAGFGLSLNQAAFQQMMHRPHAHQPKQTQHSASRGDVPPKPHVLPF